MNEKLSIQDIAALFAAKTDCSRKEAETFIRNFFDVIEEALIREKYVKVKGLGVFKLIQVESRESVNVNTGERCIIDGHIKISFIPDAALKEIINRPFAHFETVILNENVVFEEENPQENDKADDEVEEPDVTDEVISENDGQEDECDIKNGNSENSQPEKTTQCADSKTDSDTSLKENVNVPLNIESDTETSAEDDKAAADTAEDSDTETELQMCDLHEESGQNTIKETPEPEEESKVEASPDEAVRHSSECTPEDAPSSSYSKLKKRFLWGMLVFMAVAIGLTAYFSYQIGFHKSKKLSHEAMPAASFLKAAKKPLEFHKINADTLADAVLKDSIAAELPSKPAPTAKRTLPQSRFDFSKEAKDTTYEIVGTIEKYTIKDGESLVKVSQHYYGTKDLWPYIVKHNPQLHNNPDLLVAGQSISIPKLAPKKIKQ